QVLADRRPRLPLELGQPAAPVGNLELVLLAPEGSRAVEPGAGAVAPPAHDVRGGEEESGAARPGVPAPAGAEEPVELGRGRLRPAPPLEAQGGEEGGRGLLSRGAREVGAAEGGGGGLPVSEELVRAAALVERGGALVAVLRRRREVVEKHRGAREEPAP